MNNLQRLVLLFALIGVAHAGTPNTTAANAVAYDVGSGWATHYFDENTQTRWFRFSEIGGYSYCIEAVQGPISPIQLDPNLAVYTDASGTTILSISGSQLINDNGVGEPAMQKGSRICYITPTTYGTQTIRAIKLNVPIVVGSGDTGFIKFRIVNTTLFGARFMGGQVTISNIGSTAVNFKPFASNYQGVTGPFTVAAGATAENTFYYWDYTAPGFTLLIPNDGPPGALRGVNRYTDPNVANNIVLYPLSYR